MAKPLREDPFDAVDDAVVSVPDGAFDDRAGGGGAGDGAYVDQPSENSPWGAGRSARKTSHKGTIVAISLIVLIAVVVPIVVGWFASARRDHLAAEAANGALPELVVLSEEAQRVQDGLDPIQSAYIMSNGIAADTERGKMNELITATDRAILENDAEEGQKKLDESVAYFVSTYSQSLPARADEILEEFPYSEYETDERIDELKEIIFANSQGQDLTALVAAVIELPQRIGDAMSEHLGNRVTYVPPATTGAPTETPEPTTEPTGTFGPAPEPSETDGPPATPPWGGGGGPGGPGDDGDDDDDDDDDGGWGNFPWGP